MIRNILVFVLLLTALVLPLAAESLQVEPKTATYAKAKKMIIQEINFEKVPLSEALEFLGKESLALDQDKQGLNFVLKKPENAETPEPLLSLSLKKVPLVDVLRFVATLTNYHVKYEAFAISLTPPGAVKKAE